MKRSILKICGVLLAMSLTMNPVVSLAAEYNTGNGTQNGVINSEEIDLSDFEELVLEEKEEKSFNFTEASMEIDTEKEPIDISDKLNQRVTASLPDNPSGYIEGSLTNDEPMDIYFFSVTSNKAMAVIFDAQDTSYALQLYVVNYDTNEILPTNINIVSGERIILGGLPADDYAFVVYAKNDPVGIPYTFKINATNPAGVIVNVEYIANDLGYLSVQYEGGDIYGNGTFIYNKNNMNKTNTHLDWSRKEDSDWGSGYFHREHKVYNVRIKDVNLEPVSYKSTYASSDRVILMLCDVVTGFSYMESAYQSGQYHEMTFVDVTGRLTPRSLDEIDLAKSEHMLVFDLNTGKTIDFYSPLNYYYAAKVEAPPIVGPYK